MRLCTAGIEEVHACVVLALSSPYLQSGRGGGDGVGGSTRGNRRAKCLTRLHPGAMRRKSRGLRDGEQEHSASKARALHAECWSVLC